jgi:hypothetical protein
MRLYYEPDAKALHHHLVPEAALEKRMQTVGHSAVLFEKLQPEVRVIPRGIKALLLKIMTDPALMWLTYLGGKNTYYKFKSWQQFLKGAKEATTSK